MMKASWKRVEEWYEKLRKKYEPEWLTRRRYEYRCPFCGYINVRYEPCGRIVCDRCGKEFTPW